MHTFIGSIAPFAMNGYGNINLSETSVSLSANATVSHMQEIYACTWSWLIIFVVATIVTLVMAIAGAYYDLKSQGPEILGYCSLLTRDSKISMYQREEIC